MDTSINPRPSAIWVPAFLFSLVATGAFCVWAFGGSVIRSEGSLYSVCTLVFLGLGGISLYPCSGLPSPVRLALVFAVGFAVYAVIWSAFWLIFRSSFGETFGSFFGLTGMLLIMRKFLKLSRSPSLITLVALVFLWHTLGYNLGGFLHNSLMGHGHFDWSGLFDRGTTVTTVARLGWGFCYGLGMGLGLSQMIHLSRSR